MDSIALPIWIGGDSSAKVDHLLATASDRLRADPALASPVYDGTFRICCPLPEGYKPGMNRWATGLSARISNAGHLFEISETSPGSSGGYMGSCIPPSLYRNFLMAWLTYTSARQLELFA